MIPKKSICAGTRKTGGPCRSYALRGRDLCLFHEDDSISGLSLIQENAREARRRKRDALIGLAELPVALSTRHGLQAVTDLALRMELAGSLSAARSNRILRYVRTIQLNVNQWEQQNVDTIDFAPFFDRALEAAHVIVERTSTQETNERARRISDVGSARQEYLKANHDWGHNKPKPTRSPSIGNGPNDLRPFRG